MAVRGGNGGVPLQRMRVAIDKAKSAIRKAQDDMKRYYD